MLYHPYAQLLSSVIPLITRRIFHFELSLRHVKIYNIMAAEIEGRIDDAFTKGGLGLRIYASDNLETPLKHVTEARIVANGAQIHNGCVVMTEAGKNLIFQVGYKSSKTNYGFGLQISRFDNKKLVDAIYFPSMGTNKDEWVLGTVSVDDEGRQFLVKAIADLKLEYTDYKAFNQLTFTIWPIEKWQYQDKSYGESSVLTSISRSARFVGVDKGDYGGLELDMRHARIVSDDFDKRQDLAVTFLTGNVHPIKES
jgi:hypothetical protein